MSQEPKVLKANVLPQLWTRSSVGSMPSASPGKILEIDNQFSTTQSPAAPSNNSIDGSKGQFNGVRSPMWLTLSGNHPFIVTQVAGNTFADA